MRVKKAAEAVKPPAEPRRSLKSGFFKKPITLISRARARSSLPETAAGLDEWRKDETFRGELLLKPGEEDEYPLIKCDKCSRCMEVVDALKTIGIPVSGRYMC